LANVVPVPPTPAKPAQIVHTGEFSTGSQAVPTIVRPPRQVQTGGFGDPEGIGGEGKAGAKLVAHAVGAFDLPGGPGNGNGTGGDRGVRGTVASTGFGNGVANGDSNQSSARTIQRGGFGDTSPAAVERPVARRTAPEPGPETPVQILSKPVPVYTEEARRVRLEGNVLLEVAFFPNGQCKVLRLVRGLGYGLDEAAARAAQQISFRPATRNGQPVESTAVIRVVFQLAY
jgi:TonB family protein